MPGLLVVDEEDVVRQTIVSVVESSGLELHPVEEARTGQEGVTIAQHLRPSIILMDVRMPGMNGLEATRDIRSLVPEAKVIILSANDEFSFSQEALRLGAVDYLLKPVRPGMLVEALARILAQLRQEQDFQARGAEAKMRLEAALPLVEARLVHDMITQAVPPKEIADRLRDYMGVEVGWPAVIIVEVDAAGQAVEGDDRRADGLLGDLVQRALEERAEVSPDGSETPPRANGAAIPRWAGIMHDGPNTVVLVVSAEDKLASTERPRALRHRIRASVELGAPVTATVTIGRRYPTLDLVHVSYAEALRAQWLKTSLGGNALIHIDDARLVNSLARPYPVTLERSLIHRIRLGQIETGRELLSQLADYLLEIPYDPPEMIHTRFVELIALLRVPSSKPVLRAAGCSRSRMSA